MDFQVLPAVLGGSVDAAVPLVHNAGNAATGGIWRLSGPGGSAICKLARPPTGEVVGNPAWQTSAEPTHWNYWRREVLAYTSGLAATAYAEAGIVAPEMLAVAERPDGSVEVWLADVAGKSAWTWPPERLGAFARQLGSAQAGWIGRVPALPWLSRDWLGQYLASGPANRDNAVDWDHPALAAWPASLRGDLRHLWDRRHELLTVAGLAPRTLCHLDVWPSNIIGGDRGSTLLDWAFVGAGGIGEDPANLIVDAVTDGLMDARLLPAIVESVTGGYVAGLREGGWTGSERAVRRSIAAYGAAKYAWFPAGIARNAIRGSLGATSYGQDHDPAAALYRLEGLVGLLARWSYP